VTKPISIAFVSSGHMKKLNKVYRRKDKITDILTFQFTDDSHMPKLGSSRQVSSELCLGEIILCWPAIKTRAEKNQHSNVSEFQLLVVHGIAHLLGYSHASDRSERSMKKIEQSLLKVI